MVILRVVDRVKRSFALAAKTTPCPDSPDLAGLSHQGTIPQVSPMMHYTDEQVQEG
jgi:hypothetical protein